MLFNIELLTGGVLAAGVPVRAVDDRELHQLPLLQLVLALALKHRLLKTILGSTSNSSNELVKMNLFDFRRKAPTLPPISRHRGCLFRRLCLLSRVGVTSSTLLTTARRFGGNVNKLQIMNVRMLFETRKVTFVVSLF